MFIWHIILVYDMGENGSLGTSICWGPAEEVGPMKEAKKEAMKETGRKISREMVSCQ